MTEPEVPNQPTPSRSGGVHLPRLPEGWDYEVTLSGPDEQRIRIDPDAVADMQGRPLGSQQVTVFTGTAPAEKKVLFADNLGEAVKTAARTVKNLRALAQHEKQARDARERLLADIGQPSPRREDGELDTPASLNGVNVESRGGSGKVAGSQSVPAGENVDA